MIDRRDVLTMLGLVPLGLITRSAAARSATLADRTQQGRTLVLIELKGGNDGLNTVVPYTDPSYYVLRPRIGIPVDQVLPLDGTLGLNPALAPLMPLWKGGDMAIALGVGYPQPNRSHFRSIEIWETASRSNQVLDTGWVNEALVPSRDNGHSVDGIVVGGRNLGPLNGKRLRTVILKRPERFLRRAGHLKPMPDEAKIPALSHILKVHNQTLAASTALKELLKTTAEPKGDFPSGSFGRGLGIAAQLILAGSSIPVLHVSLTGFDTHINQARRHQRRLARLGKGLAAFQVALRDGGVWDRVMVMTYSEFGRRAGENGSGGTDHGTAAPQLILGGRIKGGFFGSQPKLPDSAAGDLRHTLDFRRLYATVQQRWWRHPNNSVRLAGFEPLDLIS